MYAEMAPLLHERGWKSLLPLNGKRPMIRGWQQYNQRDMRENELRHFAASYPEAGLGLAMPATVLAVDIDLHEESAAATVEARVRQAFGETPLLRIGKWPKRMLFFATTAPVPTRRLGAVELFCGSGQVALYGIHPDTGRNYTWPDQAPADIGPDKIPAVSPSQVEQLRMQLLHDRPSDGDKPQAGRRLGRLNYTRHRSPTTGGDRRSWWATRLQRARPGQLHDTMLRVSASMVAAGLDDAAIIAFFNEHFAAPHDSPYGEVWGQISGAISSFRDKLQNEDAEIAELQKQLGLDTYRPSHVHGRYSQ